MVGVWLHVTEQHEHKHDHDDRLLYLRHRRAEPVSGIEDTEMISFVCLSDATFLS